MSVVYLLHFDRPYKHAAHYLGYAVDLDARIEEHRKGQGARLVEVIIEAGHDFVVARTWLNGTRKLERKLKNWHKSSQLCPICRANKARMKCAKANKQQQAA